MHCSGSTAMQVFLHITVRFLAPLYKDMFFPKNTSSPRKEDSIVASSSPSQISQSLYPISLIFGGLKEKHRIYNFTKPFFISPSFT